MIENIATIMTKILHCDVVSLVLMVTPVPCAPNALANVRTVSDRLHSI